ncbi:hypothetical protein [Mucilaginibacter sp. OK283]|nr:hypothetical protein [Mucilaginibacter sp. OK283]
MLILWPLNQAAFYRVIRWVITDVPKRFQFLYTFMIGSGGCDSAIGH